MLSTGLGWILLRHGWTLEGSNAVVISGDTDLNTEQVVRAGELAFPKPLLEISPVALEQTLARELPVRDVHVARKLLPARLEIELTRLIPVAKALRQRGNTTEQGLVDADGQWIPINPDSPAPKPLTPILIRGWSLQKQAQLAALLRQRDRFNGTLRIIHLQPGGAISLETTRLGRIDLGLDAKRLNEQLDAIAQLNKTLPEHLLQKGKGARGSFDLSNPDRPELLLPVKPAPKQTPGE